MSFNEDAAPPARTLPAWGVTALRYFLVIAMPVFLVLTSVRLVATEAFLRLEYQRPGFPDDPYGLSRDERLTYGPYAVEYMHNDADISYLGDLTFANGQPLFTPEELRHMEDVKDVARIAFRVHQVLSLGVIAAVVALAWQRPPRQALRRGLRDGGLFAIALIVGLVLLILANWDFFFDGFHALFFESGTWRFSKRDTLIRLYPEQFWFDAAMTIGLLTVGGAVAAVVAGWQWARRAHRRPNQDGAAVDPIGETTAR
jgi:integral membrane protein (TIGR01906 family)